MPAAIAIGTVSRVDLRAFELLAQPLATANEASEVIRSEGMTLATAGGGRKAHPATKVLEAARSQSLRIMESFGMTPKGRQSVDVLPAGAAARDLADSFLIDPLLGRFARRR